jgi:hypothetical protein
MVYGDYIFMRAPSTADNSPLYQYTWMLHHAQNVDLEGNFEFVRFPFSKGMPVPKIPLVAQAINKYQKEDFLFNFKEDPGQEHPIEDPALKESMCRMMAELMKENDAPEDQFVRLGLSMIC